MSQLKLYETSIPGLDLIERQPIHDARGFFERVFCQASLEIMLRGKTIRQVNRTLSAQKGTLRGMHFQYPPYAEIKLVSCVRGEAFDVAVDLRAGSPTFLQWHGEVLSERNARTMAIPEGFAHGFQSLSDCCEMLYLHTADYVMEAEGVINALDPMISIHWPEPISSRSERDIDRAMLLGDFQGIDLT
tara:strand:- start:1833 stop:2396 length:564 start_codon:yes stop_codon:yes gene_type:complete